MRISVSQHAIDRASERVFGAFHADRIGKEDMRCWITRLVRSSIECCACALSPSAGAARVYVIPVQSWTIAAVVQWHKTKRIVITVYEPGPRQMEKFRREPMTCFCGATRKGAGSFPRRDQEARAGG